MCAHCARNNLDSGAWCNDIAAFRWPADGNPPLERRWNMFRTGRISSDRCGQTKKNYDERRGARTDTDNKYYLNELPQTLCRVSLRWFEISWTVDQRSGDRTDSNRSQSECANRAKTTTTAELCRNDSSSVCTRCAPTKPGSTSNGQKSKK